MNISLVTVRTIYSENSVETAGWSNLNPKNPLSYGNQRKGKKDMKAMWCRFPYVCVNVYGRVYVYISFVVSWVLFSFAYFVEKGYMQ